MVFLASATISRASDCDLLLLNGVFDEHDVFGFDYQKRVFLNRFCSAHYGSLQEAQNDSLNATIPIQGVMVGFGLSGNSSTFKTDYDTLCSQQDAYLKSSRLSSEKIRAANGNLAKEFRKCIVNQTGLSAWLTPTDNKQFQIRAKYRPGSGSAPYDKVDALDYDHAMGKLRAPPRPDRSRRRNHQLFPQQRYSGVPGRLKHEVGESAVCLTRRVAAGTPSPASPAYS